KLIEVSELEFVFDNSELKLNFVYEFNELIIVNLSFILYTNFLVSGIEFVFDYPKIRCSIHFGFHAQYRFTPAQNQM
ncbi:hypothetical protein GIB67_017266, partial [Kingdonia uniflora]